jgi:hypothetical protein
MNVIDPAGPPPHAGAEEKAQQQETAESPDQAHPDGRQDPDDLSSGGAQASGRVDSFADVPQRAGERSITSAQLSRQPVVHQLLPSEMAKELPPLGANVESESHAETIIDPGGRRTFANSEVTD